MGTEISHLSGLEWRGRWDDGFSKQLSAALACFVEQGYHGTSIREIALRAGMSVPGLYHYYPSKQAMLVEMMTIGMQSLIERCESALIEAGDDIRRQFDLLTECLLLFHAHRPDVAFVASSELRSLGEGDRQKIVGYRDMVQRMMDTVVIKGFEARVFTAVYPLDASRAVVTMCTSVAQWYKADGLLSPAEVACRYGRIARAMVM